jgi:hypothetical protein
MLKGCSPIVKLDHHCVIPAKAGIQYGSGFAWIPAFAHSRQLKGSWQWLYGL